MRRTLIVVAVAVIGAGAYSGWALWSALKAAEAIPQLKFDPIETREALAPPSVSAPESDQELVPEAEPAPEPEPIPDEVFRSFLVVGTDNRPGVPGNRADAILVVLLPGGDAPPILFSLPRDLYVTNPCTGSGTRINALLRGCGETVSGPELLAIGVEDFTGIPIDHFALIDFAGFERVVDALGGVEICLEYAIRDPKVEYEGVILPAGCSTATGAQALAWVRSRKTLEYVEGIGWRTQPGVNDLVRNQRQQELLLALIERVSSFRDITGLVELAESLADAVVVDEGLSVIDSVKLAWDLRGLTPDDVVRLTVPVRYYTTEKGSSVLLPDGSFSEILQSTLMATAGGKATAAS